MTLYLFIILKLGDVFECRPRKFKIRDTTDAYFMFQFLSTYQVLHWKPYDKHNDFHYSLTTLRSNIPSPVYGVFVSRLILLVEPVPKYENL